MKRKHYKIFNLLLILLIFFTSKSYGQLNNYEYIDINLTKPLVEKTRINLQSESGFSIYEMGNKFNPIHGIETKKIQAVLNESGDISLIDGEKNLLFTIPRENNLLLKSNEYVDSTIKVEKDKYRDYLRFKVKNGTIVLINHVEMDHYLYGLVPREMPASFPMEALKAQAIAARTYANHNRGKHISDGFNLCDTTHCQVYQGYGHESPSTNLAVDQTKGLLAYYNGELIDAQYHSSSSGITEDSVNVWGGERAYLKSVKDEFSIDSPHSNWTIKINILDLNKKLASNSINIGLLRDMEIIEFSPSGSVQKVKLIGSTGEEIITGNKFRTIVGNTHLKSTCFNIDYEGNLIPEKKVYVMGGNGKLVSKNFNELSILDNGRKRPVSRSGPKLDQPASEIVINGKGYGHGVGMSQYGAKKMAELGYTFEEILKHYYTGIDIY